MFGFKYFEYTKATFAYFCPKIDPNFLKCFENPHKTRVISLVPIFIVVICTFLIYFELDFRENLLKSA